MPCQGALVPRVWLPMWTFHSLVLSKRWLYMVPWQLIHHFLLTFIASLPSAMKMTPKCNSSTICPLLSRLLFCARRASPFSPLYTVSPVNYYISIQWKIINLNKLAKYLRRCICSCLCLSPWICLCLTNADKWWPIVELEDTCPKLPRTAGWACRRGAFRHPR